MTHDGDGDGIDEMDGFGGGDDAVEGNGEGDGYGYGGFHFRVGCFSEGDGCVAGTGYGHRGGGRLRGGGGIPGMDVEPAQ